MDRNQNWNNWSINIAYRISLARFWNSTLHKFALTIRTMFSCEYLHLTNTYTNITLNTHVVHVHIPCSPKKINTPPLRQLDSQTDTWLRLAILRRGFQSKHNPTSGNGHTTANRIRGCSWCRCVYVGITVFLFVCELICANNARWKEGFSGRWFCRSVEIQCGPI